MTREENERLVGEVSEHESWAIQEPMSARQRRDQWLCMDALHAEPAIRVGWWTLKDAEVDATITKGFRLL